MELAVTQVGGQYRVEGIDDQCGARQKAPVTGLVTPNPDGTLGFGLAIVTVPGGVPVHVDARITLAALGGTWTDSAGHTGTFAFNANTGGDPRPAPAVSGSGDITGVTAGLGLTGGGPNGAVTLSADPAVLQRRVTTACPAGQALRSIAESGTAVCEPTSGGAGGDITAVTAGPGLTGGGATGDVALGAVFGGDGVAAAVARADHQHSVGGNTAVGAQALSAGTIGSGNIAIGRDALRRNTSGDVNVAVGTASLDSNTTGTDNVAMGDDALGDVTTGGGNVAIGGNAGEVLTTGSENTFVGHGAYPGSPTLQNATAIGASARVDISNAMVLGSVAGIGGATATTRVGIGTTAPRAPLEIAGDTPGGGGLLLLATGGSASPMVTGRRSGGTLTAPSAVAAPAELLMLRAQGFDGSQFTAGAVVYFSATETWSPSGHGTEIRFETTANGSPFPFPRMTIAHDGDVGIATSTPLDRLQVRGDVRVGTTGTTGCVKRADGTGIAGVCASDVRYKERITAFASSLDRVAALRPVHYYWRAKEFPDKGFGDGQAYGLIAQEVEAVLPELVSTNAQGFKAVDYTKLPLLAIQALGELKRTHDALQRAHEALRSTLEARLAALEVALASRDK